MAKDKCSAAITRRHALGLIGGGVVAVATLGAGSSIARAATAADPAAVAPELLGTPIFSANIRDASAFGVWPDGRPVAYAVSNGVPMAFSALDVVTGATLASHAITPSGASYDLSLSPDGLVYISGFNDGHLYRYSPTGDEMADLGLAVPGETAMLRTTVVGDDSGGYTIFGGTYKHGHLFSWSPSTAQFTDHGEFVPGEAYLRSLTYGGGRLFIGLGTTPRLFSVDPVSLAREEIQLPEPYASTDTYVYDLAYRQGILFVYMSPSLTWLMYDVKAGTWIDEVPNNLQSGITPQIGENVYFANSGTGDLFTFDLQTRQVTTTSFADGSLNGNTTRAVGTAALGGPDFPGQSVVGIGLNGHLWHWNPKTGNVRRVSADPAGSAAAVHTTGLAPDGDIYIGGFFTSGVMARFDPSTGTLEHLAGPTQIEGMGTYQGKFYLGTYPDGGVEVFDPSVPWSYGTNPKTLFSLSNPYQQGRPFAFADTGERLAVGTVGLEGFLDGALTFYTPSTGAVQVFVAPVAGQSVTALVPLGNGTLLGGTSGQQLGVASSDPVAKVFLWDLATDTKTWQVVPEPGATDISELTIDSAGQVWGLTSSATVFEFDPATQTVLTTIQAVPPASVTKDIWGIGSLFFGPDGLLYGSSGGWVFSVDPATGAATVLDSGQFACQDSQGRIYYAKTAQLYRLTPATLQWAARHCSPVPQRCYLRSSLV